MTIRHQCSICWGGWGGLTPPLVEDDPHTGDWKFLSGGVGFDPPSPDSASQFANYFAVSMSLSAFASLYGCVLVTTSASKLLENQQPEAFDWIDSPKNY